MRIWPSSPRHPGVWLNCDSIASIRRVGDVWSGPDDRPAREHQPGIGYRSNALLQHTGAPDEIRHLPSQFAEAMDTARR